MFGRLDMLHFDTTKILNKGIYSGHHGFPLLGQQYERRHASATPLPTHLISQHFLFLQGGCIQTCKPSCALFFLLPSYLNLPLYLPRTQIKLVGSFLSLSSWSSIKLELFEQVLITYSKTSNLKHGMAQLELLSHTSRQQWHFDWPLSWSFFGVHFNSFFF